MKKSIRYLFIGLLIATLILTSIVFFRDIAESILDPKYSEYNINIVNSPNVGLSEDEMNNSGIIIGLDVEALGKEEEVDYDSIIPEVTVGDDGNYYLAGIKTDIPATIEPAQVKVVRGTTTEGGRKVTTWYVNGKNSGVEVKDKYETSDLSVEEDSRGKGLGTILYKNVKKYAKDIDC